MYNAKVHFHSLAVEVTWSLHKYSMRQKKVSINVAYYGLTVAMLRLFYSISTFEALKSYSAAIKSHYKLYIITLQAIKSYGEAIKSYGAATAKQLRATA